MQEIITEFIEYKRTENLSILTLNSYHSDLTKFASFCKLKNLQIDSGLITYLNYLESTNDYLSSTKSRKLVTIKLFFNYLLQNNLSNIPSLPNAKIRKDFQKQYLSKI